MSEHPDYSRYVGLVAPPLTAPMPLERDELRRFTQAIMDDDPVYYDPAYAAGSKFRSIVAPPLYPVHMFRRTPGTPDPLDLLREDPEADGTGGSDALYFGLEPIDTPYKRLLNGGNEIEFHRALHLGETVVVQARYTDVSLKEGGSGTFVTVTVETEYRTEFGELLLVNRQTLIWR